MGEVLIIDDNESSSVLGNFLSNTIGVNIGVNLRSKRSVQ